MDDQRLCAYTSCHSGLLGEEKVTVLSGKVFNIENWLRELPQDHIRRPGDTVITGKPQPVASPPVRGLKPRGKPSVMFSFSIQGCRGRKTPSPLPPSKPHLSFFHGRFNLEFYWGETQENVVLALSHVMRTRTQQRAWCQLKSDHLAEPETLLK